MDLVLEAFDTFLFDYPYAKAFPPSPPHTAPYAALQDFAANTTHASPTNWQFQPASHLISFPPSKWAYLTSLPRDNIYRQSFSLFIITWIFGCVVYFISASLSWIFVFDKSAMAHPKFLKNQVRMEIKQTLAALPVMAVCTVPAFLLEIRGYSKMYDTTEEGPGWWYNILQFPLFIGFTDLCIYWIHRWLHLPAVYKHLHKPHHKWIMPTPFASHAFHPLDGFAQSLPYHVFPFIFPLQKFAYVFLFAFINIWTVMIHDGEYIAESPVINGAACHTMHHLYFNYNYGQFTTLWDRLGGSYRKPNDELFRRELKMCATEWNRQAKEMEKIVKEVEGEDDRSYGPLEGAKKTQ